MSIDCLLCSEPITDHPSTCVPTALFVDGVFEPRLAHRECMLRSVTGGIGHHEDHAYWCVEMHDPDGGRSYRQSALEVDALLAAKRAAEFN